jgi:peptidoglycan/LPS O-acetylase OafA/YrhL
MPRLDGLRAVAVLLVLIEHWIPIEAVRSLSPGGAGVTLFFVLSGYLITRILMAYRGKPLGPSVAQFYWRRFLRLSPPFYAAIAVGVIFNVLLMREYWWVNGLYWTNFAIGLTGKWTTGADHFWSLCVEEQFYLIWFFVVVCLPKRFLTAAIVSSLLLTLAFRATVYFSGMPPLTTVLLPGNLASLAIGALLSHSRVTPSLHWFARMVVRRRVFFLTATALALVSLSLPYVRFPAALFYPFVASALAVYMVATASIERGDFWSWLSLTPLTYIGKISYGIFVYHMFMPSLLIKIPGFGWATESSWKAFALCTIATLVVSHLSWVFFERPILRFKDRVALAPDPGLETAK